MTSIRAGARKPYARPRGDTPTGQWQHDKFQSSIAAPRAMKAHGHGLGVSAAATPEAATRIEVSNLHYEITPKDLSSIFGQIGTLVREPLVRYDGSGRSLGSAVVTFETNAEAVRALNQFDGILAKGQPLSIKLFSRPTAPRRVASAPPTTRSLLNRIEKPPLLDRVAKDDSKIPTGPAASRQPRPAPGPIRSRGTHQHPARGGGKRGGGRPTPKTAEDLDKELDAFMGDASVEGTPTPAPAAQDVDMA